MTTSPLLNTIAIDDIISANIYGNSALPNLRNCTVIGTKSGKALINPEAAAVNHANIYPAIPTNINNPIPNDYTAYRYIDVIDGANNRLEIGLPWIVPDSITKDNYGVCLITINNFDPNRVSELTDLLTSYDFTDFNLTLSN